MGRETSFGGESKLVLVARWAMRPLNMAILAAFVVALGLAFSMLAGGGGRGNKNGSGGSGSGYESGKDWDGGWGDGDKRYHSGNNYGMSNSTYKGPEYYRSVLAKRVDQPATEAPSASAAAPADAADAPADAADAAHATTQEHDGDNDGGGNKNAGSNDDPVLDEDDYIDDAATIEELLKEIENLHRDRTIATAALAAAEGEITALRGQVAKLTTDLANDDQTLNSVLLNEEAQYARCQQMIAKEHGAKAGNHDTDASTADADTNMQAPEDNTEDTSLGKDATENAKDAVDEAEEVAATGDVDPSDLFIADPTTVKYRNRFASYAGVTRIAMTGNKGALDAATEQRVWILLTGHFRTFAANIPNLIAFVKALELGDKKVVPHVCLYTWSDIESRSAAWWKADVNPLEYLTTMTATVGRPAELLDGVIEALKAENIGFTGVVLDADDERISWKGERHARNELGALESLRITADEYEFGDLLPTDIVIRSRPDLLYERSLDLKSLSDAFQAAPDMVLVPAGSSRGLLPKAGGLVELGRMQPSDVLMLTSVQGLTTLSHVDWTMITASQGPCWDRTVAKMSHLQQLLFVCAPVATYVMRPDFVVHAHRLHGETHTFWPTGHSSASPTWEPKQELKATVDAFAGQVCVASPAHLPELPKVAGADSPPPCSFERLKVDKPLGVLREPTFAQIEGALDI